jgi:hypothetical protein
MPVIHKGVTLAQRNLPPVPSLVPAGAALDEFVFPTAGLHFVSGRYGGWRAVPFFEQLRPGHPLRLSVGMIVGTESAEANFTFDVK